MPPRRKSGRKSAIAEGTENAPTTPSVADPSAAPPPARNQQTLNFAARNASAISVSDTPKESPRETLRALSKVLNDKPATPVRRANSAGPGPPASVYRSARRIGIPGQNQNVTPTNLPSARRAMPTTPHGRAAMREVELRRQAINTPGRERRRSGRVQRDSPRDLLRALSRVLAPTTKPVERTPQLQPVARNRLNDMEDDPLPPRPRLSMPLGDDEDDSLLLPPHSDGLLMDDDNLTTRSVEMPRRAMSEIPGGKLSRGSFGSVRMSDAFEQTMPEFTIGEDGFDPSFVVGGLDDDGDAPMLDDPSLMDDTFALRRRSGRESDVRGQIPDDDTETFAFQIPQRDPEVLRAQAETARTGGGSLQVVREEIDEEEDDDEENEPFREGSRLDVEQDEEMEDEEAEEDNELEEEEEVEAEKEEEDIEGEGEDIGTEEEEESEDDEDFTINRTANSAINRSMQPQSMDETMDATILSTKSATSALKPVPGKRGRPPGVKLAKKPIRVSKHGIQYPSLPSGVVKKLATTFGRHGGQNAKISKDTLAAIMQASDWFFEQVSEDLGAYAEHRGGKTIDESDVVTLMRRQRLVDGGKTTPFALAERYLPRELLQDLRMVPPVKLRGRRVERDEEE